MKPSGILIVLRGRTGAGKTTLLRLLQDRLQFNEIEIDRIKIQNHGSALKCVPQIDFAQAGTAARDLLNQKLNVVVEEAFLSLEHLQFFMDCVNDVESKVVVIRLECSLENALIRKGEYLSSRTIEYQYTRVIEPVKDEVIFNTNNTITDELLEKIENLISIT